MSDETWKRYCDACHELRLVDKLNSRRRALRRVRRFSDAREESVNEKCPGFVRADNPTTQKSVNADVFGK